VIATSYDIGVAHHGGYAEYGRVPADWVVPLPKGMSLHDSMALGTAGYTAALGMVRMEENGLKPENGKVIVSGATGGVGSIAIDILARLGYEVVALTGKESQADYLKGLGAKEVMLRSSLDLSPGSSRSTRRCGPAPWTTSAARCWPGWPAPCSRTAPSPASAWRRA
jgi:acrylyl-CoA reductase (NADPH)